MIFKRITRGAKRASILLSSHVSQFVESKSLTFGKQTRTAVLFVLAARIVTLPIPVTASSYSAIDGLVVVEDTEPLSISPLYSAGALSDLELKVAASTVSSTALVSTAIALQSVQVADSRTEVAAQEAEVARIAEEARVAEAARIAEEARVAEQARIIESARIAAQTKTTSSASNIGTTAYDEYFQKYFKGSDAILIKAICTAESGLRPNAVSPTNDHGLCQINWPSHSKKFNYDLSSAYDPETNIRVASIIFYSSGPRAWTVYRTEKYQQYMPQESL